MKRKMVVGLIGIILVVSTACQQAAPPAPTVAPAPTAVPTDLKPQPVATKAPVQATATLVSPTATPQAAPTATAQDSFAVACSKECEWTIKEALGKIDPTGLAIDRQGNVVVLNYATARIMTFDPTGKLLSQMGKAGNKDGQLSAPIGIAYDSQGSIYVVDPEINFKSAIANATVMKFDTDGKYLKTFASKDAVDQGFAYGIVVDARDNVYATMPYNDRIDKYDSSGKYLASIGTSGSGDGQIKRPSGLAMDAKGALYVADLGNYRVSKLDSADGKFLAKITSCGSNNTAKFMPVDLRFDAAGNLYVLDNGSTGVCKYDANGKFLSRWGSAGAGDGQFALGDPFNWPGASPAALAVDKQGNVYVADLGNHRVVKFKPR